MGKYYLGLSLGKGTTGWAITKPNYKVIRKHGQELWGIRQYPEANAKQERRMYRTARRNQMRKNRRIMVLQELFAEEINKIDPGFFMRLKESKYYPEDKKDINGNKQSLPYALFVDKTYTDKDFYKQFPTIYHLRNWLMYTDETPDIRLVYLAIHHIMKNRGHFLLNGNINNVKEFDTAYAAFENMLENVELDFHINMNAENKEHLKKVLQNAYLTKSEKKKILLFELAAKSTCEKSILTLLAGGKVKLMNIYDDQTLKECERPEISFSDASYDEYCEVVKGILGDRYEAIEAVKVLYDWSVLQDILDESLSLSESKIKSYEKHKEDLAYLKALGKEYLTKEEYNDLFHSDNTKDNYCHYIGMTKKSGKKVALKCDKCTKKEFYDYLKKKVLPKIEEEEAVEKILNEIEIGKFMPKQVIRENSILPHQLHLYELNMIIENLKERITMLEENKEKLNQLLTFRIPYYVGPVGAKEENPPFAWAVRKSNETIYPWNFEDVIDMESTAEKFIIRMTNKCTYLKGEDVLPKDSLLYSKFTVLNELNNLHLNGKQISVDLKQELYHELFEKKKTITGNALKNYLVKHGYADKNTVITGIDTNFKSSLRSYHDMNKWLGDTVNDSDKEEIIKAITLFGEDKELLKKRISRLYPSFTREQLEGLSTLSYKGWGRLSKAFLNEIAAPSLLENKNVTIVEAMWETNHNLMQILSDFYKFKDVIEQWNSAFSKSELTYEDVDTLYVSQNVKRQIWQTVKVVKELEKVMGTHPSRLFIDVREEKSEIESIFAKKRLLQRLYKEYTKKNPKKNERDWCKEVDALPLHELKRKKLYLYYLQKGKCMYSGEDISLDDLWDNDLYNIDHIYPQSKVLDDSIDNLVLVKTELNREKSDKLIEEEIQKKNLVFWNELFTNGFISEKKYERLTRITEFTAEELTGFITGNLVARNANSKVVVEILKMILPHTEFVYTSPKVTNHLRQTFKMYDGFMWVKEINDLYYAKNAYLNIVAGNVYRVKFGSNVYHYMQSNTGRTYNLKKIFFSKKIERDGEVGWITDDNGSINTVKKQIVRNSITVSRKTSEATGTLFNVQPVKKGHGQLPLKRNDERLSSIEKYGGYNSLKGAYFMLVQSDDKNGLKYRSVEFVPLHLKVWIEKNEENAITYLKNIGLKNPKILIPKINMGTLFKLNGFKMYLTGRSGDTLRFMNANILLLSQKQSNTLKNIIKFYSNSKLTKNLKTNQYDGLKNEELLELYDLFLDKLGNTLYVEKYKKQYMFFDEKRSEFIALSKEDKCTILYEMLHMFQTNATLSNLKLLGGGSSVGTIQISKRIDNYDNLSIIYQSVTGIYEKEIKL